MAKKEKEFSEYVDINWRKLLPILIGLVVGAVTILGWVFISRN